jgi:excisionase family DNA binding protein
VAPTVRSSGVAALPAAEAEGIEGTERTPMQGDRSAPTRGSARLPTLADLIAAGELTCSAAQVAQFLRISKPTVIAAARRGELPGRRVGKQWRFSCKELAHMFGERLPAEGGGADAA